MQVFFLSAVYMWSLIAIPVYIINKHEYPKQGWKKWFNVCLHGIFVLVGVGVWSILEYIDTKIFGGYIKWLNR